MTQPYFTAGRWYYSVKNEEGQKKTFTSKKAGRSGRADVVNKAERWLAAGSPLTATVADMWGRFLVWYQTYKNHREGYRMHEMNGRVYILPVIGTLQVSTLKYKTIQSVLDKARTTSGAVPSRATLCRIRCSLNIFINYCCDVEEAHAPARPLLIPCAAPVAKERQILSREDIYDLFHVMQDKYINIFRLGLVTGLRIGELLGLQLDDIDFTKKTITINRSINTRHELTPCKNNNARRVFGLSDAARSVILAQIELNNGSGSVWLFPGKSGGPSQYKTVARHYRDLGLPGSPHCLRHTFISLSRDAGVPLPIIKAIAGHSSAFDTLGVYGHVTPVSIEQSGAFVDDALRKIGGI